VLLENLMKMLKALIICALVGVSGAVLAEGGSDRLIERIETQHGGTTSK
jgi:hypothetical protein